MAMTLRPVAYGRAFIVCALAEGETCEVLSFLADAVAHGSSEAKAMLALLQMVADSGTPPNLQVFRWVKTHDRPKEIMEFKKGALRLLGFRDPHYTKYGVIVLSAFCTKEHTNTKQSATIERVEDMLAEYRRGPAYPIER